MSLIRDALLEKCDVISVRKDGVVTKSYVLYKGDGSRIILKTEDITIAEIDSKIVKLQEEKAKLISDAKEK